MAGPRSSHQVIVHMDPELHEAVRRWAEAEDRSLSAQVRRIIRDTIPNKYMLATAPVAVAPAPPPAEPPRSYADIVREFRRITSARSVSSGLCCERSVGGIPKCCADVLDGNTTLLFTAAEIEQMNPANFTADTGVTFVRQAREDLIGADGLFALAITAEVAATRNLREGPIADTLDLAAWPTVPILRDGNVIAVGSFTDCVAGHHLPGLLDAADELLALWRAAVTIVGLKPWWPVDRRYDRNKIFRLNQNPTQRSFAS